jgi:hypothetical protein
MNVLTFSLLTVCSLLLGINPGLQSSGADALQSGEWLVFETLDLKQSGTCYDVAFYRDGIVFLKSGEETLHLAAINNPDPDFSQPLFSNEDFSCSPAALSFSDNYSRAYYTRPVLGDDQAYREQIFEMSIKENEVSGTSELAFSGDPSRNLHPAVSSDGSLMVFSSDRLPTSGGLDLFVSRKTADGWSQAINLGESINSSGHDWFPFLDKMNNLWFSSTGHSGYGGFDIYVCPYKENEWGLPQNLGEAVNGPQNELGFSVHPREQVALFSRAWPSESRGMSIRLSLNEEALDAAGIDEASARAIAAVMLGMANPPSQGSETETEVKPEPAVQDSKEPEPLIESNQDPVVFRVQIISSLYENSFPSILIDGKSYSTYEYFYLGSYRITVGKFDSLKEANTFRAQCLNSGFKQAFVAAFRGDQRETDPSVFKQ